MWMKPAGASVWKVTAGGRLRGEAGGEAVPLQAAVNAAARQLGVEAAPHGPQERKERDRDRGLVDRQHVDGEHVTGTAA